MVTEYPVGRTQVPGDSARGADRRAPVDALRLPYTWPSRTSVWGSRVVLLPILVGIPFVFVHYPVDRFFLHTEGRVIDGWVGAGLAVGMCFFMLIGDGNAVRLDGVRLSIRSGARQHDYSWGDVAGVRHEDTGLVVTDQQGESVTIRLVERPWQARLVRRRSPMIRLAADLERIRLQVRAPVNLTRQVRVGRVRLTPAEWTYAILVTLGAVAVATLRTLGL
ncbi:hypothetical protein [Promicromonospora panici]|uniref:hypothetical protein n=1 Tax=Promicromonospora panici TaxID=2219658 RepID=UPI00101DBF6A|nr:hypothetical protein [Promicromonospora panici]